ncbi:TetR/AcrR family transcriptional regulator [Lactococcus petauri]|uniref:TetR/AcrR family transcriptional regulator n=1 Tax=Lactococcus petauri TaxID=1940789 RepID=UPI0020788C8E|nr:TetR/AcrR family transcriptional regulator [Lactococcus petauri]USI67605.1 TetR/AcrR family transcriptional regulator [Lactococcus petauri]WJE12266.1 TetR/AcrR family transcriptional regulator [Lactococcus petauri]
MTIHEEQKFKTNEAIINSLVILAETKPLSKISVSDITKIGNINRGTFYLHYESKEDLIENLEAKLLKEITKIVNQNIEITMDISYFLAGKPYPVIGLLIDFVFENQKIFKILLNSNTSILFRDSVKIILQDIIIQSLKKSKKDSKYFHSIPDSYVLEIISSSILAIIMKWIEDTDEMPPEEVSKLIMCSLFLSPYEMLDLA